MKLPPWLPPLNLRDERQRAAAGITPKKDGWYKSIDDKVKYICKPCPVAQAVAILPGRVAAIRAKSSGSTTQTIVAGSHSVESLIETYLAWLYQRVTTGRPKKLARRTYDDNVVTLEQFAAVVGPTRPADSVGQEDFSRYVRKYFEKRAPTSIRREIIYIEALANWGGAGTPEDGVLSRPWFFGPDFNKPADSAISASAGESDKAYSPKQLRKAFLAVKDSATYRAVGWLALNGAFIARDLADLPESLVDLEAGEIRFPRGKTGVQRLTVLWKPTVRAMRAYLASRPIRCHPTAAGLLFRTSNGLPYSRAAFGDDPRKKATTYDGLGNRWFKITGMPLSGLRATFATIADDWPDQRAVDIVLGHKSAHKDVRRRHYAKRFSVERVQRLVAHVLPAAFGRPPGSQPPAASVLARPVRKPSLDHP